MIWDVFSTLDFLVFISSSITSCSTAFLTEDGLFDMIRASNHAKAPTQESKKSADNAVMPLPKKSPKKVETKSMLLLSSF